MGKREAERITDRELRRAFSAKPKPKAERVCGNCDHFAQSERQKRRGPDGICTRYGWNWTAVTNDCARRPRHWAPIVGRVRPTRARGKGVKP